MSTSSPPPRKETTETGSISFTSSAWDPSQGSRIQMDPDVQTRIENLRLAGLLTYMEAYQLRAWIRNLKGAMPNQLELMRIHRNLQPVTFKTPISTRMMADLEPWGQMPPHLTDSPGVRSLVKELIFLRLRAELSSPKVSPEKPWWNLPETDCNEGCWNYEEKITTNEVVDRLKGEMGPGFTQLLNSLPNLDSTPGSSPSTPGTTSPSTETSREPSSSSTNSDSSDQGTGSASSSE